MYKIGEKVETPIGIGIIKWIDKASKNDDEGFDTLYVSIAGMPEIEFNERHIKPYVSAHEKLLALGWEEKIHDITVKRDVESGRYKQYVKGSEVILIDIEDKEFTTYTLYNGSKGVDDVSWVNLTLSRILTQYLEELEK